MCTYGPHKQLIENYYFHSKFAVIRSFVRFFFFIIIYKSYLKKYKPFDTLFALIKANTQLRYRAFEKYANDLLTIVCLDRKKSVINLPGIVKGESISRADHHI